MELPKHIASAADRHKTSIGNNPCLPPEEEQKFVTKVLSDYFGKLSSEFGGDADEERLKKELGGLIARCKKLEKGKEGALEEICVSCIGKLFDIPEDTLEIKCSLVGEVDTSTERMLPEKNDGFTFEDMEDMDRLTGEVYKRRVLDALVAGVSLYYATNFKTYFQETFEVEGELPSLYKKIMRLNNLLLFLTKDGFDGGKSDGGKVDVYISGDTDTVKVEAEGILFPILFCETVKGILELAISNGLPEEKEKAMYVMGKSDFKLAELWDMRIGVPLWGLLAEEAEELGYNVEEVGVNFILMELSMMEVGDFNKTLKEMLAGTKKGKALFKGMLDRIVREKEMDDFNDFMDTKGMEKVPVNDDDYFEADDLLVDSEIV